MKKYIGICSCVWFVFDLLLLFVVCVCMRAYLCFFVVLFCVHRCECKDCVYMCTHVVFLSLGWGGSSVFVVALRIIVCVDILHLGINTKRHFNVLN